MIIRVAYRAQCRKGMLPLLERRLAERFSKPEKVLGAGRLLTTSLFKWGEQVFCYAECFDQIRHPDAFLGALDELLIPWPGAEEARIWVPLVEVFFFNKPENLEQWKRTKPVEQRIGKVARLRPEKVASYAYFHYQLQEERAFAGEKYKYITLHENLLFQYDELPATTEFPSSPGKLGTHGTPVPWTDSRMDLHFIPWDETHPFFKPIELMFSA